MLQFVLAAATLGARLQHFAEKSQNHPHEAPAATLDVKPHPTTTRTSWCRRVLLSGLCSVATTLAYCEEFGSSSPVPVTNLFVHSQSVSTRHTKEGESIRTSIHDKQ